MINDPPNVYYFRARIVRWIDADTVLVDPLVYREDIFLRVRLRDRWEPEIGENGADLALEQAIATLGLPGDYVWLTNTRHHWTYGRLEARVDPA